MNRCLHITIHDNAGTLPRGVTPAPLSGWGSTDPGSSDVIALVDDPESSDVIAPVDDPSGIRFPSGGSGVFGTVAAATGSCGCCTTPASVGADTLRPFFRPRDYSGFVIVRMARGIEHDTARSLWQLAKRHEPKLAGLKAALEIPREAETVGRRRQRRERPQHFVSRPLVELPAPVRAEELDLIRLLEQTAATSPFPPRHSLTLYWRLDLRQHPGLVEVVAARLNRLAEVDLAYRELAATDPQTAAMDGKDFAEDQGYLSDAPMGIGASWAWKSLPAAPSPAFTICDLEQGWVLGHDDLKYPNAQPLVGTPLCGANRDADEPGCGHHGTAVLGILVATGSSSLGIKGAAAGLGSLKVASHYKAKNGGAKFAGTNGHVAEAILLVLNAKALTTGDVLLLEVQRGHLPAEVDEADFDAIRLASGLGVIVVEAAGNGGFDFDAYGDPSIGRSLHRGSPAFRDSGAILVGAARAGLPHDRALFSNYGSRLDCFGWGESVTTCGYGDLAGSHDNDYYTNRFSGTSSASAIVAGAAALLQSVHQACTGMQLEPRAIREILADSTTGTRQGPNVPGNIGVMPDLKAIVRNRLQLVPDVYLRRSIGDDGSASAAGDEISSSPDILISSQISSRSSAQKLQTVISLFGAGSPGENLAAPGEPVVPGGEIYLRLRNRGLGEGKVHVQLFASPAATLITPEHWLPVGRLDASQVGQIRHGDNLVVVGPVPWVSGAITPPPQAWSLLAILSELEENRPQGLPYFGGTGGMPPGPPYFDWAEYRAFLRGPGVAWRNTHHDATSSPTLDFIIAGTPDRARHFDFEVIQRLPAGATVTLQVPPALAAKLRQRQPWLGGGTGLLPKRPRTAIRGVELAAGAYAEATFTVDAGGPALTAGHSLALRQLWRGEEVGRITWFFGPDA